MPAVGRPADGLGVAGEEGRRAGHAGVTHGASGGATGCEPCGAANVARSRALGDGAVLLLEGRGRGGDEAALEAGPTTWCMWAPLVPPPRVSVFGVGSP